MATNTVVELPKFDTGQYEGCEFHMVAGDASLVISITEWGRFTIVFRRVRWHQFTSLYLCSHTMIKDAYFRLAEMHSPELAKFVASDPRPPYRELHHYRIFLDETGCHEVFAESAHTG